MINVVFKTHATGCGGESSGGFGIDLYAKI